MGAKTRASLMGIDAVPVDVEEDISRKSSVFQRLAQTFKRRWFMLTPKDYYTKGILLAFILICGLAGPGSTGIGFAEGLAGEQPGALMVLKINSNGDISVIESVKGLETNNFPVRKSTGASSAANPDSTRPRIVIEDKEGNSLYETEFSYPKVLTIPPPIPGTIDDLPAVQPLDSPEVTLVVPFFSRACSVRVFDSRGSLPSSSVMVEGLAKSMSKNTNEEIPLAAPAQQGKLNILLMASGYGSADMSKFESRAAAIKNALAATPPFSSYPGKINVNVYKNTADLGCFSGCGGIDRSMCCNSDSIISSASSSGYYFDEIIVVHNTGIYSGGGYRSNDYKTNSYTTYCMVYDGEFTVNMVLHEFGHSFGDLCDEYSYTNEGISYLECVNCRATCNDWSVYASGCNMGCDAQSSYFRPEPSIMLTLDYHTYNDVSIKSTFDPQGLVRRLQYFTGDSGSKGVYCGYGSNGLWKYDDAWTRLSWASPDAIASSASNLYASFGSYGLYKYDGDWNQLSWAKPDALIASGTNVFASFSSYGLYKYDGTWARLTWGNPTVIASSGSTLYAAFASWGLYKYDGTWTQITWANPDTIAASGSTLYASFGPFGLYKYDGTWTRLTWAKPDAIAASGSVLYAVFSPYGLYKYDGTWTQLSWGSPGSISVSGSTLYGSFGTYGLYKYDGAWTPLAVSSPDAVSAE